MKTLYLFGEQSCHLFYELKRCASKNAVLRYNKRAGKSVPEDTKCKVAGNPHRFDCHQIEICPSPNVLAYSKSP